MPVQSAKELDSLFESGQLTLETYSEISFNEEKQLFTAVDANNQVVDTEKWAINATGVCFDFNGDPLAEQMQAAGVVKIEPGPRLGCESRHPTLSLVGGIKNNFFTADAMRTNNVAEEAVREMPEFPTLNKREHDAKFDPRVFPAPKRPRTGNAPAQGYQPRNQ